MTVCYPIFFGAKFPVNAAIKFGSNLYTAIVINPYETKPVN